MRHDTESMSMTMDNLRDALMEIAAMPNADIDFNVRLTARASPKTLDMATKVNVTTEPLMEFGRPKAITERFTIWRSGFVRVRVMQYVRVDNIGRAVTWYGEDGEEERRDTTTIAITVVLHESSYGLKDWMSTGFFKVLELADRLPESLATELRESAERATAAVQQWDTARKEAAELELT